MKLTKEQLIAARKAADVYNLEEIRYDWVDDNGHP